MSSTNGNGHAAVSIREQLREARARLRLRETQVQTRLLEGYGFGDVGNVFDAQGNLIDQAYPLADMGRWLPLGASLRDDRKSGNNGPFIITEQQLDFAREAARFLAQRNPFAIGVLETVRDFVVGEGILPRVTSKEKAVSSLIQSVQDELDQFIEDTEFEEFQQELVIRRIVDGEWFLRFFEDDETLQYRIVEPEQVRQPIGSPDREYSWGILTDTDDVQIRKSYCVYAGYVYGDDDDFEDVKADQILHATANVFRNVKRGLSDFYATEESFNGVVKLLRNMRVGAGIRAAIPGFYEHMGSSSTAVDRLVAAKANAVQFGPNPNPITGKQTNTVSYEPGTIPHLNANTQFKPMPPNADTPHSVATVQAVLRGLAVRWGFPEYFISADASNNNFASILVSGSPTVLRVKTWQKYFKRRFSHVYWRVLKVAHEAGRIGKGKDWDEIQFLIQLQLEAPNPVMANELETAQVDQIDMQAGVLSKQTRRQRRQLDNEQEVTNIQAEPLTPTPAPERVTMKLGPDGQPAPGGKQGGFFPRLSAG